MNKKDIPADIPKSAKKIYLEHYAKITKNSDTLFLFAADHKIEHLNKDFSGGHIPQEVNDPKHLFEIASNGEAGAFATQMGLISQYGNVYPNVNYIVKLNSKTDIIPTQDADPVSTSLWTVDDVIEFQKNSGLHICGVGYTIYLGSKFEHEMLTEAAQMVYDAHHYGLITILWVYPRGKHILNEQDPELIAGAAGVAAAIGSDFVKIHAPKDVFDLKTVVQAAGKTKVLCSGGPKKDKNTLLQEISEQIHFGDTAGVAIGRNIYQNSLQDAIALTKEISRIVCKK